MSYILDALKRAEAERDRGAVPGLNARPVPLPAPTQAPGSRQTLWLALASVLALGGAAAGWWFWHNAAPAPVATVAMASPAATPGNTTPPAVAPVAPPAPPVASVPGPAAPAVVAPPPQATPATPPAVAAPVPTATPLPAPATAPTPTPVKSVPTAAPAQAPAKPAAPSPAASPTPAAPSVPAATATAPAASNLPLLSELPADLRSQLPKMAITGAVYSKDPAQRLLLINNQVFTQGGNVAPGLDLQEIQPHNAIFNFQGTRFRMTH